MDDKLSVLDKLIRFCLEKKLVAVLRRWRATRSEDGLEGVVLLEQYADVPACELARVEGHIVSHAPRGKRRSKPLCVRSPGGLELHAGVLVAEDDRTALERLCRYIARPPIPQDRLQKRADGKFVLSLKRTWKGGVRAIVFEPLNLIARLAALIPAPYLQFRHFYGVFAPHHKLRDQIVPAPPEPNTNRGLVAPKRPKSMPWADLLMRVFAAVGV